MTDKEHKQAMKDLKDKFEQVHTILIEKIEKKQTKVSK